MIVHHPVDLLRVWGLGQQLDGRVCQAQGRERVTVGVTGAVEGADAALPVAGVDGQSSFVVLMFCSADDPLLAGPGEHALEGGIGDALQDGSHGVPQIEGDLWMSLRFSPSGHRFQIGHQVWRDGAPAQHVRGVEGGKDRRVAPALAGPVQVGQARYDAERCLVATGDHVGAVIGVGLHLGHDDLGDGVAALQAIAHAEVVLGRAIAEDRDAKMEGHASALPDAHRGPEHRFPVQDVGRVVGRAADDGDARRVLLQPVIDGLQAMVRHHDVQ
jgi:hypothetical protein